MHITPGAGSEGTRCRGPEPGRNGREAGPGPSRANPYANAVRCGLDCRCDFRLPRVCASPSCIPASAAHFRKVLAPRYFCPESLLTRKPFTPRGSRGTVPGFRALPCVGPEAGPKALEHILGWTLVVVLAVFVTRARLV
ncbi:SCO1431 family membrane protein [Streptomyces sp. NPDC056749]|uniref:SCO1431 family membrane protein n=1 Tax=Streptomyces sp. NPDC056749 TaxID=3345936 RepID=UPI0036BFF2A7